MNTRINRQSFLGGDLAWGSGQMVSTDEADLVGPETSRFPFPCAHMRGQKEDTPK